MFYSVNVRINIVVVFLCTQALSTVQALEKSKYEQSLESVRRFIKMAEKELELYYRHIALYGDPNNRNPMSILDKPTKVNQESRKLNMLERKSKDSTDQELSELEDDLSTSESDSVDESLSDFDSEEYQVSTSRTPNSSSAISGSSSISETLYDSNDQNFIERKMDIKI